MAKRTKRQSIYSERSWVNPTNEVDIERALKPAWITSRQIEVVHWAMTRNVRRGGKIWTHLNVADNSGAQELMCIRIIETSNRRYAHIGNVIIVVIKEAVPNSPLERSKVIGVVIVCTSKELKHDNYMIIRYDDNAAVGIMTNREARLERLVEKFCVIYDLQASQLSLSSNLIVLLHVFDNPLSKFEVVPNMLTMFARTFYASLPNLPWLACCICQCMLLRSQ
ncbi:hypothetical protein NC652_024544 [Populus alba x Populus x berolinensis]|nr:hypothetical protein NC652_024544 [Populus alba x Populus x berolinensis]